MPYPALEPREIGVEGKEEFNLLPRKESHFSICYKFPILAAPDGRKGNESRGRKNRSIYSLGPHSGFSFHSAHGEAEKNTHEASKPGKLFSIYAERPADGGLKLNHLLGPYLLPFPVWKEVGS